VLRSWRNDVYPPVVRLVSVRVTAGRPLVIARVLDRRVRGRTSGVDPSSLVLSYRSALVAAAGYDPDSGLAVFELPASAPQIPVGRLRAEILAADFQEAKNVATPAAKILPNTTVANVSLRAVAGPTVTWLEPVRGRCVDRRRQALLVAAGSDDRPRTVSFFDGKRRIARVAGTTEQLYAATWQTGRARRGAHTLKVVVRDGAGREASAVRRVRVCR
jgi:hypothetical protein